MAYVTPPTTKKNALSTTLTVQLVSTAAGINAYVADTSVFYDVDGNLITQGWVFRNPNNPITGPREVGKGVYKYTLSFVEQTA